MTFLAHMSVRVYVGFPRIAQNGINKSTLSISSLEVWDPTPDSFVIKERFIIGNHNIYHPRLDAFNVSLSADVSFSDGGPGRPFAFVELPAIYAKEQVTSDIEQVVRIIDVDAFTDYNKLILTSEEFRVDVRGRTGLHEMSNPVTTVDYRKTVTMKGMYCWARRARC